MAKLQTSRLKLNPKAFHMKTMTYKSWFYVQGRRFVVSHTSLNHAEKLRMAFFLRSLYINEN